MSDPTPNTQHQTQAPIPTVKTDVFKYPVSFTGTGSEYFKIWIVNLLLTLITCGLYYPWAKVRKNKYIYRNTMVDGIAFDYLGKGSVLARGMIVSIVLAITYNLLIRLGNPVLSSVFILSVSCAMPWLIWKSLRFRMSVTTYCSLPFAFSGKLKDLYKIFGMGSAIFIGFCLLLIILFSGGAMLFPDSAISVCTILFMIFSLVLPAFIYYKFKQYQYNSLQWTGLNTQFNAKFSQFIKPFFISALPIVVICACLLIVGVVIALAIPNYTPLFKGGKPSLSNLASIQGIANGHCCR